MNLQVLKHRNIERGCGFQVANLEYYVTFLNFSSQNENVTLWRECSIDLTRENEQEMSGSKFLGLLILKRLITFFTEFRFQSQKSKFSPSNGWNWLALKIRSIKNRRGVDSLIWNISLDSWVAFNLCSRNQNFMQNGQEVTNADSQPKII